MLTIVKNCQPVRNDLRTYENIRKTNTGQGNDSMTVCLLDYPYFQNIIS